MSDIESKYQMLSDVEHVKKRPGMFLGSTSETTSEGHIVSNDGRMVLDTVTYNPALLKMFDEIISNSVDEHIRSKRVKNIWVDVNMLDGSITVTDDGGIPVKIHPEHNMYIPSMIFGELRTGSNFSDDSRLGSGMNGLGSKLVSIFSSEFVVETSLGGDYFKQVFLDGLNVKGDPIIKLGISRPNGTKIKFIPDYKALKCELDNDNFKRIEKRVYDVAGCNPKIKVRFNGELIDIKSFSQYVKMYTGEQPIVEFKNNDWNVIIAPNSDDTFKHVSFVNGVDTFNGGTHIDYIINQITNNLREHIKKKHKVDIKPNNIKQQLTLFVNCTVNAPTFTSQTKEFMSLEVKEYGTVCELDNKFFKQLIDSEVLQKILDWVEAEQRRKELAELRTLAKKTQNTNFLKKIVKFDDASSKNRSECSLVLTEGDSAAKSVLSSRDPSKIGVFPLKGKPLNVRGIKISKLTTNQEFANIMAILGLKLGHDDMKIEDLRFSKLIVGSDFDPDGGHIFGLVINMFQQFWPNLIKEGFVYRLKTPLIVATVGKKTYEFFSRSSYNKWNESAPKHSMSYFKGLGSWESKDFKRFLNDEKYLEPMIFESEEDFSCVDLAFDKSRADDRKEWLMTETNDDDACKEVA